MLSGSFRSPGDESFWSIPGLDAFVQFIAWTFSAAAVGDTMTIFELQTALKSLIADLLLENEHYFRPAVRK